jgi:hypothetical protein
LLKSPPGQAAKLAGVTAQIREFIQMIPRTQRKLNLETFVMALSQIEGECFDLVNEFGAPLHDDDDPSGELVALDRMLVAAAATMQTAISDYRTEHARLKADIAADGPHNYADPDDYRRRQALGYGHLQHEIF